MLRKFSIITFVLSTTIYVMGVLLHWFPIFFLGLAAASLVGIFVFKEDSKSDSQPK